MTEGQTENKKGKATRWGGQRTFMIPGAKGLGSMNLQLKRDWVKDEVWKKWSGERRNRKKL